MINNHKDHRVSIHVATTTRNSPAYDTSSTDTLLLDSSKAHMLQGWPTSPKPVRPSLSAIIFQSLFDIVLLLCSLAFLAFAQIVVRYDQAPTSENPRATNMLRAATKYSPTVFPLLFASVIGRAAYAILLWRLENGERIEILDTLASSTSLTSTVTSQFQLRRVSVWGTMLIAMWALSPIGGQASIRQMTVDTTIVTTPASFRIAVPDANPFSRVDPDSHVVFVYLNKLFTSAMVSSTKTRASPLDMWGNVKIPMLEYYEKSLQPDDRGWYTTNITDNDSAVYSSLIGIPMDGYDDDIQTTDYQFHAQSPYLHFRCTKVNATTRLNDTDTPLIPAGSTNVTDEFETVWFWWSKADGEGRDSTLQSLRPFNFFHAPAGSPYWLSCAMTSTYVELEVSCTATSTCRASRVRRSQLSQLPSDVTMRDMGGISHWSRFLETFLTSQGGGASLLSAYLRNPALSIGNTGKDPWSITDESLSTRLGQLLNSYFVGLANLYTITGGINNETSYFGDTNITFVPPYLEFGSNSSGWWIIGKEPAEKISESRVWPSQGTKHKHVEVIIAHKAWTTTLSIISILLILACLISPLVRHFLTTGPDVAMNFSSLATRNNAYVPLSSSGTYLDAADRYKLLKDVRLRLGDAERKADVGNLVIGSHSVGQFEIERVRKGRMYE